MLLIESIVFDKPFEMPKPTLAEFLYQKMKKDGPRVIAQRGEKILSDNGYQLGSPYQLNSLGYLFMNIDQLEMAKTIFELNIRLYPNEANSYDSLADVQMRMCQNKLARKSLLKALELDPKLNVALVNMRKLDDPNRSCSVQ